MKLYEIGLWICGVLGVLYGVGFGMLHNKRPDDPGVKRIGTIGAFVLGAIFAVTIVLFLLGK